jgi:hypothetical protein
LNGGIAQGLDQVWPDGGREGVDQADPEVGQGALSRRAHGATDLARGLEQRLGPVVEHVARRGALRRSHGAVEDLDAEHVLEVSDGLRNRRLGRAEALGGGGHAACLDNGYKGFQSAKIDVQA